MNIATNTTPYPNKLKTPTSHPGNDDAYTDVLSISFNQQVRLINAQWLKPVGSADYRQAVRMIARTVAFVRAKLVLINEAALHAMPTEDQQWTDAFLKEAFRKAAVRKAARVVHFSTEGDEDLTHLQVQDEYEPNRAAIFGNAQEAYTWLIDGQPATHESEVKIPLNINLKLLRNEVLRKAMSPTETLQLGGRSMPDLLHISTDFMAIDVNRPMNCLSIRWRKPPATRQYRYGMLKAGRILKEHKLERILLNNQRLGVLTLEDQSWLVSTAIQVLPLTNLKRLAVITSADALQQLCSESIGSKLKEANLPYSTRYFLTEEEAREWLLSEDN